MTKFNKYSTHLLRYLKSKLFFYSIFYSIVNNLLIKTKRDIVIENFIARQIDNPDSNSDLYDVFDMDEDIYGPENRSQNVEIEKYFYEKSLLHYKIFIKNNHLFVNFILIIYIIGQITRILKEKCYEISRFNSNRSKFSRYFR